jgi:nucleoside-diphosphate-sugar epimerase
MPSPGYYKVLVAVTGEGYNIGTERLRDLDRAACRTGHRQRARALRLSRPLVRKANVEADYLVDNPNRRCPVIDKARRHLGYDPSVPFDEGLRRSLIWYHYHRGAEEA